MTIDQIMGLIRQVLPLLGGLAMALGFFSPSEVASWTDRILQIAGPLLTLGGVVWAMVANSKTSIIKSASQMPEVEALTITDPKLAQAARTADPTTQVNRT